VGEAASVEDELGRSHGVFCERVREHGVEGRGGDLLREATSGSRCVLRVEFLQNLSVSLNSFPDFLGFRQKVCLGSVDTYANCVFDFCNIP